MICPKCRTKVPNSSVEVRDKVLLQSGQSRVQQVGLCVNGHVTKKYYYWREKNEGLLD